MQTDELIEVEVTVWMHAPNDDGQAPWIWEGVTADGRSIVTFSVDGKNSLIMRKRIIDFRHFDGPELPRQMLRASDFITVEKLD